MLFMFFMNKLIKSVNYYANFVITNYNPPVLLIYLFLISYDTLTHNTTSEFFMSFPIRCLLTNDHSTLHSLS
jgi:hypothetical protein